MTQFPNQNTPVAFDWSRGQTPRLNLPSAKPYSRSDRLDDLAGGLKRWAVSGFGKVCLTAAGLYILFGIGLNFAAPFQMAWGVMLFVVQHPAFDWLVLRVLCMTGLIFWAKYLVDLLGGLLNADAPAGKFVVPAASEDHGNGFGRYAVEDFREQSPYGDASLAKKREIARALVGQAVTHTPKFEE